MGGNAGYRMDVGVNTSPVEHAIATLGRMRKMQADVSGDSMSLGTAVVGKFQQDIAAIAGSLDTAQARFGTMRQAAVNNASLAIELPTMDFDIQEAERDVMDAETRGGRRGAEHVVESLKAEDALGEAVFRRSQTMRDLEIRTLSITNATREQVGQNQRDQSVNRVAAVILQENLEAKRQMVTVGMEEKLTVEGINQAFLNRSASLRDIDDLTDEQIDKARMGAEGQRAFDEMAKEGILARITLTAEEETIRRRGLHFTIDALHEEALLSVENHERIRTMGMERQTIEERRARMIQAQNDIMHEADLAALAMAKHRERAAQKALDMANQTSQVTRDMDKVAGTKGGVNIGLQTQTRAQAQAESKLLQEQGAKAAESFARKNIEKLGIQSTSAVTAELALKGQQISKTEQLTLALGREEAVRRRLAESSPEQARMIVNSLKAQEKQYDNTSAANRRQTAATIGNSISLFVLGITIGQTLGAVQQYTSKLARLAEEAEKNGKSFKILFGQVTVSAKAMRTTADSVEAINTSVRGALGPIQVMTGLMQVWAIANRQFATTALPIAAALFAITLAFQAFNMKSNGAKIVLLALAGAIALVGVYLRMQKGQSIENVAHTRTLIGAKMQETSARTANSLGINAENVAINQQNTLLKHNAIAASSARATAGVGVGSAIGGTGAATGFGATGLGAAALPAAAATGPGGLTVIAGAIGIAALAAIALPTVMNLLSNREGGGSFATMGAESKFVSRGGLAMLHRNETVSSGGGGSGTTNNYYISGNMDTSVSKDLKRRNDAFQVGG